MDGTKPDMLAVGGLTMKDSVDAAIAGHRSTADALVTAYTDAHRSSGGVSGYERADRADQDMTDLRLNQMDVPTYRGDE